MDTSTWDEKKWLQNTRLSDEFVLFASAEQKADKQFMMKILNFSPMALKHVDPTLRADDDVLKLVTRKNVEALRFASSDKLNDKPFMQSLIKIRPQALRMAPHELRNDPQTVLLAVNADITALRYAAPELRQDIMDSNPITSLKTIVEKLKQVQDLTHDLSAKDELEQSIGEGGTKSAAPQQARPLKI